MRNPFEFGRELGPDELVDRQDEVAAVARAMEEGERLFLIGPRRFGKTSILHAASTLAEARGVAVLRQDAEAFPTLTMLAQALVAEAAKKLTSSAERAGQKIKAFFSLLRPELSYNPLDGSYGVRLASQTPTPGDVPLLVEVLAGLDRMAADAGRPVAVVLDEFQHVVEEGGVAAERQLRAAVQRHAHVGYVFAGSQTGLLTAMTGDASRPFYRLGARRFIGPIPRADFREAITRGFQRGGMVIGEEAIEAMLDAAGDVPYNVQRLAHAAWQLAREENGRATTPGDVARVLETLVRRDDPFYTQTWNRLTAQQQKALMALVASEGDELYAREVLRRYGLALSTMRTSLEALVKAGVARTEETRGTARYALEDPFFAAWMRVFVPSGRGVDHQGER